MLSRFLSRHNSALVAEVTSAIKLGGHNQVLLRLNEKKRLRQHEENIDYCRALCFLTEKQDVLHARQALLEELRHFPGNAAARMLLYEINGRVRHLLLPPKDVVRGEPLFGLLCDALLDHTMLTWTRLYSLYNLAKAVCCNNSGEQGGALVECGVAGGGSVVLLAVVAAHYSSQPRRIYALDTFDGMPEPTESDALCDIDGGNSTLAEATSWGSGTCSSLQTNVQRLAKNFNVEEQLVVVPGMFQATVPSLVEELRDRGIAMLHVDADWYESTKSALELTWPAVRKGSVVQVDDYCYWNGCRKAVDEFIQAQERQAEAVVVGQPKQPWKSLQLQSIDGNAVYFTKP